jgi:hypothetical protein
MTNLTSSFIEKLKEATRDLHTIQEEVESKIQSTQVGAEDALKELKTAIEKIKRHLTESLNSHSKSDEKQITHEKSEKESVLDSLLLTIKPFFEEVLDKLKTPSVTLSNVIDITSLKLKLASIYTCIFIREQKNKIIEKIESSKEKLSS